MRVLSVPFRRVGPDRVSCEPWQSSTPGAAGLLPSTLPHWDYNVDLRLARSVILHEAAIRRDCRLDANDRIHALVVWRSSGTALRGKGSLLPLGNDADPRAVTLSAEIPGRLLSADVEVSTQLVLAAPISEPSPLAAQYPGSVLWEDRVTVALEGRASRFPMEVVDFNTAAWAPYGGAGWYVSWNSDDLHEPFLRSVRLFVNGSHPAVLAAVQADQPTDAERAIRSAIYYDTGRQLIRGALENDEFVSEPEGFVEGSTGRAVLRMLAALFPGERPIHLRSTMRNRREYFDATLQASFKLFAEGA